MLERIVKERKNQHQCRCGTNHDPEGDVCHFPYGQTRSYQINLLPRLGLKDFAVERHHELFEQSNVLYEKIHLHGREEIRNCYEKGASESFQVVVDEENVHRLEKIVPTHYQDRGSDSVKCVEISLVDFIPFGPQPHQLQHENVYADC